MRILIAPNAFKHSLSASEVALAIKEGLEQSRLSCNCTCFPVGDGGDGTCELILAQRAGTWVTDKTVDALGRQISASYGLIDDGKTAVIEMANASGLRLLSAQELNPMHANSFGTGLQVLQALDGGATKIILAMGGSATVDGGCGILAALGAVFLNAAGEPLKPVPAALLDCTRIDLAKIDSRLRSVELVILCDVDNRLLGPNGAAAVFGPQKGAAVDDIATLDRFLGVIAMVAQHQYGKDIAALEYGGTAGGAAAGLYAFLDATLVNGIDHFLTVTDFDQALSIADLVITGEGSIDEQTLQGKGPYGVAKQAKRYGLPVIVLAGKVPRVLIPELYEHFDVLMAIGNMPEELSAALSNAAANISRTAFELGNLVAVSSKAASR